MTSLLSHFEHVTSGSDNVTTDDVTVPEEIPASENINPISSISSIESIKPEENTLPDSFLSQFTNEIVLDKHVICSTDGSLFEGNSQLYNSNLSSGWTNIADTSSSLRSSSIGDVVPHLRHKHPSKVNSYEAYGGRTSSRSTSISGRTSSSEINHLARNHSTSSISGGTPKFIKDTTSYWYKPDITRKQALLTLRDRPPGTFVVRDSRFFPGSFGLVVKVHEVPAAVLATADPGVDLEDELIRHYLIEPSMRGVRLKGCADEPVFGSLSALIYQHSITSIALPCKLIIPTQNLEVVSEMDSDSVEVATSAAELLQQGAACNVLFLGSADTEALSGPEAIERAMRECTEISGQNIKTSVVQFKVSTQGITLTDMSRRLFFRRHYPTSSVKYCGMDPSCAPPHSRTWDATKYNGPRNARVFGFVARKQGGSIENSCHLFAELDSEQPSPAIVNFVVKVLLGK